MHQTRFVLKFRGRSRWCEIHVSECQYSSSWYVRSSREVWSLLEEESTANANQLRYQGHRDSSGKLRGIGALQVVMVQLLSQSWLLKRWPSFQSRYHNTQTGRRQLLPTFGCPRFLFWPPDHSHHGLSTQPNGEQPIASILVHLTQSMI